MTSGTSHRESMHPMVLGWAGLVVPSKISATERKEKETLWKKRQLGGL